jgi:hypothetical protein
MKAFTIYLAVVMVSFVCLSLGATDAKAQVCKDLATVEACVTCSVKKGGTSKFSVEGIRRWCTQQIANRPAKGKK